METKINYNELNKSLIKEYLSSKNKKILTKLVELNYPLVVNCSKQFNIKFSDKKDIIQEGCIGLIHGINKFNPNKGTALSTYVSYWIRCYMFKYLINNNHLVKLNNFTEGKKLIFNLEKEKENIKSLDLEVDDELDFISKKMNIDKDKVELVNEYNNPTFYSLNTNGSIENKDKNKNYSKLNIPNNIEIPSKLYERKDYVSKASELLNIFRSNLSYKEQYVFDKRLLIDKPETFASIGGHLCISKQRIHQIEVNIKDKLGNFLKAQAQL